jgi:hypothetical protein
MWRWRDWVIDAYNANMPFDAFTVEQLAGDMLPDATLEQRIATGFNRNHRGNAEGGIIPEEYAVEYVVDRVETTATVWLGLTLGCARCHNHKYDPIAQKEFYRVFAYFNNVPERGKAVKIGNSPPMIPAPTRAQRERLAALQAERTTAQKQFAATEPALNAALAAWASSFTPGKRIDWSVSTGLLAHYDLEGHTVDVHGDGGAGAFIAGSDAFASGRLGLSGHFDGERFIDAGDVAKFDFFDKFSLGAWVRLDDLRGGTIVSRMTDVNQGDGYALVVKDGRIQVNLVKRWLDDAIRVETDPLLEADTWRHVMATYDGSRVASGVTIYVDGSPVEFNILVDELNQSFDSDQPLRIGAGGGPDERFRGRIDEVRIYDTCLSAASVALVATDASITEILATPAAKRNPEHADKLRAYFLAQHAPPEIRQAQRRVLDLDAQHERLIATFPTVMVMQERKQPRPTFVLARGAYDQPGEPVSAGVPASLSARSDNGSDAGPNDRVGFARWLVDPSNPLTARVAVNRYWQMYFGTGLVKTSEDFGTQGERPSHPMLLDWLASEFMHRGWDVKAMQRAIVTSATYRQSSHATPAMRRRDPDNRLLAHGPRFRLPAEAIRDQALAVSGLLTRTLCGPSVKPYQPEGLWNEIATTNQYDQSTGADLYRRSLYTYWKRTVAPPSMMTFDAAGREMCSVRSSRTNTPLQALTLLNDVTFVEASRALAERMITEGGSTPEQRIAMGFRLATARAPQPRELAVLVRGLEYHRQRFGEEREAGVRLMNVGESPRNDALDVTETAAYATIAGLILNLDEVVTKE